jgi:hypothetical protein
MKMGRFLIANPDCDDITPRRRDRLERFVRVMLAGNIAQHRFKPRSGYREFNLHADRHKAVELLSHFTRSNEELGAYLRLLQIQTKLDIEAVILKFNVVALEFARAFEAKFRSESSLGTEAMLAEFALSDWNHSACRIAIKQAIAKGSKTTKELLRIRF